MVTGRSLAETIKRTVRRSSSGTSLIGRFEFLSTARFGVSVKAKRMQPALYVVDISILIATLAPEEDRKTMRDSLR